MGTAVRTAKTSPASWDAFADVDAFVDEVLMELAAMAGTRPTRMANRQRDGAASADAARSGLDARRRRVTHSVTARRGTRPRGFRATAGRRCGSPPPTAAPATPHRASANSAGAAVP